MIVSSITIDVISLVISAVAIGISVIVYNKEKENAGKLNIINLESDIYKEIFFVYLIDKIPNAREKIKYNNKKISNVDSLMLELNNMRKRSLFFKYKDIDFYKQLKSKLQELEDYLVDISNRSEVEHDDFGKENEKINQHMEQIYRIVMKKYSGYQ